MHHGTPHAQQHKQGADACPCTFLELLGMLACALMFLDCNAVCLRGWLLGSRPGRQRRRAVRLPTGTQMTPLPALPDAPVVGRPCWRPAAPPGWLMRLSHPAQHSRASETSCAGACCLSKLIPAVPTPARKAAALLGGHMLLCGRILLREVILFWRKPMPLDLPCFHLNCSC